MLLGILLFAVWSSCFALGKMTLAFTTPLFLTAARMLFASFFLLGYLLLRKRADLKISKKDLIPLLLLAFFSVYLTNAFEFWGLQHLTAAKTCFIYSLSPFFAALFSYLHFGEKMNLKKWLGMGVGFLGFLPVLSLQAGSEQLIKGFFYISLPELAIMGAAIASVYGWVLLRLLVKNNSLSPLAANGISMLIGGSMALLHSFLIDTWHPLPIIAGGVVPFLKGTLLMTFISNLFCYNLYGFLLRKYTATFLSFIGLLSPIFASLSGWILLGEAISPIIFISTSIVILGLWIVYREELKQGYILKKAAASLT